MKRTPLHGQHLALGARMVEFAGWEMPIHYGSQVDEHHAVRRDCGIFDVSHMCVVDLRGARVHDFLRRLLANDVAKLRTPGRALYSCMLEEDGGILDDLIATRVDEDWYRLVLNAGSTERDLAWIGSHAPAWGVTVSPRDDLGIIAVQGPNSPAHVTALAGDELGGQWTALKPFHAWFDEQRFVSRTGYTGEDGFELVLPHEMLVDAWQRLVERGVQPCGLGARDTLRLEAGMLLYGQDMDVTISPIECGLGWTVSFDDPERDFIGRKAIEDTVEHPEYRMIGLVLEGRGVLRPHQTVYLGGEEAGVITSGGFSPTLKQSIGLARVDFDADGDAKVDIRGRRVPARKAGPPWVRKGMILV